MRPPAARTWFVLGAFLAAAGLASAQEPAVERIEVRGNQFLQPDTILYYVTTKVGSTYSAGQLRSDFRKLWNTGFFDDLRIDADDTPAGGKVVVLTVKERPRVLVVDFRGSKALSKSTIEDELREKEAALRLDSFYDPAKVRRVEEVIKAMLMEKGHPFATLTSQASVLGGGTGRQVSFIIDDGAKAVVKQIDFVGNTVFSDGDLRGAMKKIKERRFWNLGWLGGKNTFTDDKWTGASGDYERLQNFFLDRGYVAATIGRPVITYVGGEEGGKPKKYARLEIPVSEGGRYRVGDVKIAGMSVFKEEAVRGLFKLKKGDVYNESRIRKGYDKIRDYYGAQGYFQMQGRTDRDRDDEKKIVHVTLNMEEDKRYYVGRISFTGNSTTRDKVIRREVYLNEGDVFNTELLKQSIRRINQLGYFKPMEGAPELQPSELGEDRLDVKLKVEEQNRNQFTLGGGVSGIDGVFINSSFQTTNFLGLGETVTLNALRGGRSSDYSAAVTEPYLFDRPITAGAELFSRKIDYYDNANELAYSQVRTGGGLTSGIAVGQFTRLFGHYVYEVIDTAVRDELRTGEPEDEPSGEPTFSLFADHGRSTQSRFSPQVVYDTVDNPYAPRRGMRFTGTFGITGGPLGGTVDFFKPSFEAIVYVPHTRRTALGLRSQVGYLRPFGDTTRLPYYERYFLGGENQIRGVNPRTVSPINAQNQALGGNKFLLFNAEYYLDIASPLRFLLFFDAGEAYLEGHRFNGKTLRTSAGAELRFLMPVLNVPFRLIYAWNANRDVFQPKTAFKFAIGTTF